MNERRKALEKLALGVAAIPAAGLLVGAAQDAKAAGFEAQDMCRPPGDPGVADFPVEPQPPPRDYPGDFGSNGPKGGKAFPIPDIPVLAHDGSRSLLYTHLLKDRVVLLNMMSTKREDKYPVTEHMVHIQKELGDRLGRDVHMYSITMDPLHDTVERLAEFAAAKGVGPNWKLLTGHPKDLYVAQFRFFGPHGGHHGLGMVRYGNVKLGLWGGFAAKMDPAQAIKRVSWVQPGKAPAEGVYQRRGPAVMAWKRSDADNRDTIRGEA